MAEIVLFHHAQGVTPGIVALAEEFRSAGHIVHMPDLFDGNVFDTLGEGMAYAESIGFGEIVQRGVRAVEGLSNDLVYAGFSLGVLPAQCLAQTREGARGALLFHACVRAAEFGSGWPGGLPAQIHAMDADPFFVGDGDIDAARAIAAGADDVKLFLYPGDRHLFSDRSLADHDAAATETMMRRSIDFLKNHPVGSHR
ncbi:dienelactone hydrolase family protein [Rhizobiaceae bacterium n13]|uniref:dienelactone hydrolase family protein n=1 Tax=Ferirhizobium litorale TaxID=2927786 RepID=UPI0024B2DE7F|nr:dienelactone hydrolase family protein [Fererhizobium litorale]MDI7861392.1 dienelactone hydrolase family protein [Fererhizobium litorale]